MRFSGQALRPAATAALAVTAVVGVTALAATGPQPSDSAQPRSAGRPILAAAAATSFDLVDPTSGIENASARDDRAELIDVRASRSTWRLPPTPEPAATPAAPPAPAPTAPPPAPPAPAPAPTPTATPAPTKTTKPPAATSSSAAGGGQLTLSTARTGAAVERGLRPNALTVLNAVRAAYPQITTIGGVRADSLPDHPSGRALDFHIPNYGSGSGIALGDAIVAFLRRNAGSLGVTYIIWRQRIYNIGGTSHMLPNRGGTTANHYDHVHVTVR